jgi:hypothetical protein
VNSQAPRMPMLERDQVTPEVAALYHILLQQRGVVPNMIKTAANIPALAQGIVAFLKPIVGGRRETYCRGTARSRAGTRN